MRITTLCGILLTLPIVACGGSGDEGGQSNGGSNASSSVVGTWKIDSESVAKAIEAKAKEEAGENAANVEQMLPMLKAMAQQFKLDLTMNADQTFSVGGTTPNPMGGDPKKFSAKGTWKVNGASIEMTTTEEDGKAKETPETKTATLKDGALTLSQDGMSIILRK